jgi:hypothetical protein
MALESTDIAYILNMEPKLRDLRFDLRHRIVRMVNRNNFPFALLGAPGYADVIRPREYLAIMRYAGKEYPPESEAVRPALESRYRAKPVA